MLTYSTHTRDIFAMDPLRVQIHNEKKKIVWSTSCNIEMGEFWDAQEFEPLGKAVFEL